MKILIIHQYFNTPDSGGPLRSYYLARGLRQHGYQVEVITSHNQPQALTEEIKGFTVHYLPVRYDNSFDFLARIRAFILFANKAWSKARIIPDVELCYAISTPLTIGWTALRLKKTRQIPYIFEVGDLWPEAPIQMKVIRNPLLIGWLRAFEKKVYEQAHRIIALSPGIRKGIHRSHASAQVALIPNMADCQYFKPAPPTSLLKDSMGLHGKFLVLYFGAAGKANHLDYLVDAARAVRKTHPEIHFLVMAQGSELARIRQSAGEQPNLQFLDYGPRKALSQVLDLCDAVYVSYAQVPILGTGSPNKFFDGLAAGKMILVNFHGWLKEMVESHELGIYTDPTQPDSIGKQLEPFIQNKALTLKCQRNSRNLAEQFFSRELAVQKVLKVIDNEHQIIVKDSPVYTLTA